MVGMGAGTEVVGEGGTVGWLVVKPCVGYMAECRRVGTTPRVRRRWRRRAHCGSPLRLGAALATTRRTARWWRC